MPAFKNLTGQVFDHLTVIKRAPNRGKNVCWECHCECGTTTIVMVSNLGHGTRSCGCRRNAVLVKFIKTHGMRGTPEYQAFHNMKTRCNNPNHGGYPRYGGRGIRVEWKTFEQFFADMGTRPSPQHTIERLNNDGPYSRENCIWATRKVQANNTRRNRRIEYEGQTYTLCQLAEHLGIHKTTLTNRLKKGFIVG